MFNLDKFISDSVTFRPVSMFAADIDAVCNDLDELQQTSLNFDNMQTVKKMKEIVPEFKSKHSIYEQLDSKKQE